MNEVRTSSLRERCRTYVKPFRIYSRKKESYRLLSRKGCGLLSVSILFTVGASRVLANPFSRPLVRFSLPLDSPLAPTPYGQAVRSLQRAVFTNFISFLWGIKSSRSRPRREERKRELECESDEGEVLGPNHPSRQPYHPRQSVL